MNRCVEEGRSGRRPLLAATVLGCVLGLPMLLQAQEVVQRSFPANALRGMLEVTDAPDAVLNGRSARLAPGARIRDTNNLLTMPAAVTGRTLTVHYTLDFGGQLKDVWILRADEAARFWPRSAEEAARCSFDPAAQTWTR